MQEIERIDPNITIACFSEQPSGVTIERMLSNSVKSAKPLFNPGNVLLYSNLRVQHVWLREIDCTSWLQHAVYIA